MLALVLLWGVACPVGYKNETHSRILAAQGTSQSRSIPARSLHTPRPQRRPSSASGGCATGDDNQHALVIDFTIAPNAAAAAGSRGALSMIAHMQRASETMMAQFHVWLEIGDIVWQTGQNPNAHSQRH